MFDHLLMLQIDLIACRLAIETDDTRPPIEVIDEAIVGRAIKEYFSDCDEWSDDLLEPALAEYRKAKKLDAWAATLAAGVCGGYRQFLQRFPRPFDREVIR